MIYNVCVTDIIRSTFRQICQRGSQREGSPSYVLLHSDEENDVDEDVITLANINRTTSYNIMNLQIKSDDTLQALALRYRCTVSGKYVSLYIIQYEYISIFILIFLVYNSRYPN